MSHKMYAFEVPKGAEFEFTDRIRQMILDDFKPKFKSEADKIKYVDFIQDNKDSYESELQFFSLTHPAKKDVYLALVLSSNYHIQNWLWEQPDIKTCNYDDRADIPPEDEGNRVFAEEIDHLINKRHYFTIPIVSIGDLLRVIWITSRWE